ncbi:MAG: hypothetical protein LBI87_08945, partial [Candidatus Accumulibacter sp.]|nr:hypothetical protein [Accumulibacter sp.]
MTPPAHTRPKLRVVLIQPEGYAHSAALSELAETLLHGLDGLGLEVGFAFNELATAEGGVNIVLGAHLLDARQMRALPAGTILYNSEQIDEGSVW